MSVAEFILGTAKLGMPDYGFSSKAERMPALSFLRNAWEVGVRTLDTSPRYGNAEDLIGKYHACLDEKYKICTKVDGLQLGRGTIQQSIFASVERSLKRMRITEIDTLYLHQNALDIISDEAVLNALSEVKKRYPVSRVGASIYSYEECLFAIKDNVYDVVQVPISILDSHIYSRVKADLNPQTKIVARSLFLQGTLLNRDLITSKILQSQDLLAYLAEIDKLANSYQADLVALACAYVVRLRGVYGIVVGTTNVSNLKILYQGAQTEIPAELLQAVTDLANSYKVWGNPRNW
jgi:aryl-alcohol dehydrogenase-like predicted oxidoreductase